jgi:hypothetical protein
MDANMCVEVFLPPMFPMSTHLYSSHCQHSHALSHCTLMHWEFPTFSHSKSCCYINFLKTSFYKCQFSFRTIPLIECSI